MANLNFNDVEFNQNTNSNNRPGFFSLANDGDEAIVRFMHDSVDTFDIVSTHDITLNGRYRKISCLRTPHDSIDICPFCASGDTPRSRIYIKLIEYTKNQDGSVTATPRVWERSINYAKTLKSYIDNYGPLSDIICKVIRHGVKGSMQTTYEIVPNLSKAIYPDSIYVKDYTAFEGYTALGSIVLDKSEEEIKTFMATGNFPDTRSNTDVNTIQQPVQQYNVPYSNQPQPIVNQQPYMYNTPDINQSYRQTPYNANEFAAPPMQTVPVDNPAIQRPRRY